eukprot:m.152269 g.152269  ORF g.152269 m.152269 type:complete len:232 (+) comp16916_c0_seq2:219-914(+)
MQELAEAEAAVERGEKGAKQRLRKAEDSLDKALAAIARFESSGAAFIEGDGRPSKPSTKPIAQGGDSKSKRLREDDDDGEVQPEPEQAPAPTFPNSFSRVPTSQPAEELQKTFPDFARATSTQVDVHAGEMLYLPAGWFHEVHSAGTAASGPPTHMAFNYWFHPPTKLGDEDVNNPYDSDFWARDWQERQANPLVLLPLSSSYGWVAPWNLWLWYCWARFDAKVLWQMLHR